MAYETSQEKANFFRVKGNNFFKAHDYVKASHCYRMGLTYDATNSLLYCNLSQVNLSLKLYLEAESDAKRAIELDSDNLKGYFRAAKAAIGQGDASKAMQYLRNGMKRPSLSQNSELQNYLDEILAQTKRARKTLNSSTNTTRVAEEEENVSRAMSSPVLTNPNAAATSSKVKGKAGATESYPSVPLTPSKIKGKVGPIESKDIDADGFLQTVESAMTPMSLFQAPSQMQKRKITLEFYATVKDGSEFLVKGLTTTAATKYKVALDILVEYPAQCLDLGRMEEVILKYAISICWSQSKDHQSIVKAIEYLTYIRNHFTSQLPAVYYALGSTYSKLNRFHHAAKFLEKGLSIIKKKHQFDTYNWPGSTVPIKETTSEGLKDSLLELLPGCKQFHPPDAICKYDKDKCFDVSNQIITSECIYFSDPDFMGFVIIICQMKCKIQYHLACWKDLKEHESDTVGGKVSDKDMLGWPCPTDDCVTATKERSVVVTIKIIGENGVIKTQCEREPVKSKLAIVDQLVKDAKKNKKKTEKAKLPAVEKEKTKPKPRAAVPLVEKKVVTPVKTSKTVKGKVRAGSMDRQNDTSDDDEGCDEVGAGVDSDDYISERLSAMQAAGNYPGGDRQWQPMDVYYGHEDLNPDMWFITKKVDTCQDFIFSFFYDILNEEGPQQISDIEEKWDCEKDQCEEYEDLAKRDNFPGIINYLSQSYHFVIFNDYIGTYLQASEVFNTALSDITDCFEYLIKDNIISKGASTSSQRQNPINYEPKVSHEIPKVPEKIPAKSAISEKKPTDERSTKDVTYSAKLVGGIKIGNGSPKKNKDSGKYHNKTDCSGQNVEELAAVKEAHHSEKGKSDGKVQPSSEMHKRTDQCLVIGMASGCEKPDNTTIHYLTVTNSEADKERITIGSEKRKIPKETPAAIGVSNKSINHADTFNNMKKPSVPSTASSEMTAENTLESSDLTSIVNSKNKKLVTSPSSTEMNKQTVETTKLASSEENNTKKPSPASPTKQKVAENTLEVDSIVGSETSKNKSSAPPASFEKGKIAAKTSENGAVFSSGKSNKSKPDDPPTSCEKQTEPAKMIDKVEVTTKLPNKYSENAGIPSGQTLDACLNVNQTNKEANWTDHVEGSPIVAPKVEELSGKNTKHVGVSSAVDSTDTNADIDEDINTKTVLRLSNLSVEANEFKPRLSLSEEPDNLSNEPLTNNIVLPIITNPFWDDSSILISPVAFQDSTLCPEDGTSSINVKQEIVDTARSDTTYKPISVGVVQMEQTSTCIKPDPDEAIPESNSHHFHKPSLPVDEMDVLLSKTGNLLNKMKDKLNNDNELPEAVHLTTSLPEIKTDIVSDDKTSQTDLTTTDIDDMVLGMAHKVLPKPAVVTTTHNCQTDLTCDTLEQLFYKLEGIQEDNKSLTARMKSADEVTLILLDVRKKVDAENQQLIEKNNTLMDLNLQYTREKGTLLKANSELSNLNGQLRRESIDTDVQLGEARAIIEKEQEKAQCYKDKYLETRQEMTTLKTLYMKLVTEFAEMKVSECDEKFRMMLVKLKDTKNVPNLDGERRNHLTELYTQLSNKHKQTSAINNEVLSQYEMLMQNIEDADLRHLPKVRSAEISDAHHAAACDIEVPQEKHGAKPCCVHRCNEDGPSLEADVANTEEPSPKPGDASTTNEVKRGMGPPFYPRPGNNMYMMPQANNAFHSFLPPSYPMQMQHYRPPVNQSLAYRPMQNSHMGMRHVHMSIPPQRQMNMQPHHAYSGQPVYSYQNMRLTPDIKNPNLIHELFGDKGTGLPSGSIQMPSQKSQEDVRPEADRMQSKSSQGGADQSDRNGERSHGGSASPDEAAGFDKQHFRDPKSLPKLQNVVTDYPHMDRNSFKDVGSNRLIEELRKRHPNSTVQDLQKCVEVVRNRHESFFTIPFSKINDLITDELDERAKAKKNAWGQVKADVSTWKPDHIEEECVICMDKMDKFKTHTLDCQHTFHQHCLKQWLSMNSVCPMCNRHSKMSDEYPPLK